MKQRTTATLVLASALWLNCGCLHLNSGSSDLPPIETPTPSKTELPAAKSAELNLSMADAFEKNGKLPEAAACYEKARQSDPRSPQPTRRLAGIYDKLGENKRALEEYQRALKATPRDPYLLNNFGYFHYSRGRWKDAEAAYRQALAINPKLACAHVNLGLTLAQQERYDESLTAFTQAITRPEALSNLAFILSTRGKKEEAKRTYREALNLDPNLRIAQLALQKLEHPGVPPAPPAPLPPSVQ